MKLSERYWNEACGISNGHVSGNYWTLRDLIVPDSKMLVEWAGDWFTTAGISDAGNMRAFLFFMAAEMHRVNGE
jgi:hypothetical protein